MPRLLFPPLLTVLVAPLWAGSELKVEHRDLTAWTEPSTTTLKISSEALRVHQLNRPEEDLLFHAPAETVWLINHNKKRFHKLTKSDLEGLANQLADAIAKVQETLAALTPEQRASVEKMMATQMPAGAPGAAPAQPGRWEKIASNESVGRWTCDRYRYLEGDQIKREIWVAPLPSAGIDPGAWTVMGQLGEMFQHFAQKMPMAIPQGQIDPAAWNLPPALKASSFPVKFIEFKNGQPASETRFASIETVSFPPETFAPPAGYLELALSARP